MLRPKELLGFDNGEPLTIIGNGDGSLPEALPGNCVLFNQRQLTFRPRPRRMLRVLNSRTAAPDFEDDSYVVSLSSSDQGESSALSVEFQEVASDLSERLGCWPSCGLVAFFWAVDRGFDVSCHQMALSPSLAREVNWPAAYAPPTAYHNYLGERRLALTQLSVTPTLIDWPEILLADQRAEPEAQLMQLKSSVSFSLSEELLWLQDLDAPVTSRRKQLEQFVSQLIMDPSMMLAAASDVEAERFFYLPRNIKRTGNWWLYDYEASLTIERLVATLRQYQQRIYLHGKLKTGRECEFVKNL